MRKQTEKTHEGSFLFRRHPLSVQIPRVLFSQSLVFFVVTSLAGPGALISLTRRHESIRDVTEWPPSMTFHTKSSRVREENAWVLGCVVPII